MRKYLAFALVAGLAIGCGEGSMESTNTSTGPLAKQAASVGQGRAVAVATVTGAASAADLTVAFSASVSGNNKSYLWSGTTDAGGTAEVEIVSSSRRGASGYYVARVTDSAGDVLGSWSSIPINGGRENVVTLAIGGRATVSSGDALEPKTVFTVRVANVSPAWAFSSSGVFNTPTGASEPGPLTPGNTYEFEFTAAPGSSLSFATMFIPSNDFFYAPGPEGIALWENGSQVSGDITSQIQLWDSGSEIDQEPGTGADQAQRQSGPDTGAADADPTVRLAADTFSNLPAVTDVIQVTITPTSDTGFNLSIENISTESTLSTADGGTQSVPLAPGVFVVHTAPAALFDEGVEDTGTGLAALAEDGNPGPSADYIGAKTGLIVPQSPGIWVVHTGTDPIFTHGQADRGQGLEAIAEDGGPLTLADAVADESGIEAAGIFNTPVGSAGPGPIGPGGAYTFSFSAEPGDRLSFANMFVSSNDFFFAPDGGGIDLFPSGSASAFHDVTSQIAIWDAGTEIDQEPGTGLDQVQRQSGPDTGASDPDATVRLAADTFGNLPNAEDIIRVTITAR